MIVDSHCHLNFPDFKDDLDAVVQRARDAGVKVMQTICTDMAEFEEVYGIAEKYDGVYASVGVHPNETLSHRERVALKAPGEGIHNSSHSPHPNPLPEGEGMVALGELLEKTKLPKVIGIGETGLDYHYGVRRSSESEVGLSDAKNSVEIQKKSFRIHISAARESGLPLIVHSRDADQDTINILSEEMQAGKYKGLIHCFTSSKFLADAVVKLGLYISPSGIITFKNAQAIRDAIQDVPLDRLLVETDAPYLAPVPFRGKRNEPAYTAHTNKMLADIKNISETDCARITTENFFRLFDKAAMPTA